MSFGLVLWLTHLTVQTLVWKIACCLKMPLSYVKIEYRKIQQIETIQAKQEAHQDRLLSGGVVSPSWINFASRVGRKSPKVAITPYSGRALSVLPQGMRRPIAKTKLWLEARALEGHNKTPNSPFWLAKWVRLGEALPPERPQTWGASH